jgi:hypothetical protein
VALADAGVRNRVASGLFRPDLYHRLAGYHAKLPPLRSRPEDIVPAARALLRAGCRRVGRALHLAGEAERLLAAYPWPGNFRELETVLLRAAVQIRGEQIGPAELGLPPDAWPRVAELAAERRVPLIEVQRLYGLWVLALEGGNVSRAARALGVSDPVIIWRHVLPNATVATITFLPFVLNGSITTLTSLDFLGFGLPPGSASLGELLAQGKANLQAPWLGLTAFFVLALMLSLLIFIGEAVRDAFDPRKIGV